jgi:hypothetical protein
MLQINSHPQGYKKLAEVFNKTFVEKLSYPFLKSLFRKNVQYETSSQHLGRKI